MGAVPPAGGWHPGVWRDAGNSRLTVVKTQQKYDCNVIGMQAKQRVQFFQLADVFLASGMVPAYTAAAFVKKFARLALRTTPAGEIIFVNDT